MWDGLLAGLLWGLNTVIIGIALSSPLFFESKAAIFLAPFVSTFIHDLGSSLWMLLYMGLKNKLKHMKRVVNTRGGRFIVLAALLGGPVGMTGYVLSINYIGAAYTAIISAMFPAVGAFFSYLFLKEKMTRIQMLGLFLSILGVIALGYTPGSSLGDSNLIGFSFALLCVLGWSSEAVIVAYGLQDAEVDNDHALQIRQLTSAVTYGVILLPLLRGWKMALSVFTTSTFFTILLAALSGTTSYLFYYKAIDGIGPTKAMALNITYTAWAIGFGYLLLREPVSGKEIICALMIIGGSVVAAGDVGKLLNFKQAN